MDSQNPTDAPTQRILIIAETIARHGPITLTDLTQRLGFSRAAVWRAVDTMRGQGWIRMRLGDHAFELRSSFVALLSAGHAAAPAAEQLDDLIAMVQQTGPVHVDIGQFTGAGICQITESSRKQIPAAPLSLCDDDLAIAAQLLLTPTDLLAHLRAYIETAPDDQRRVITSGDHGRNLARLRSGGVIWAEDRCSLTFCALPGIALRAELWRSTRADIANFAAQMPGVIATLRPQTQTDSPQP